MCTERSKPVARAERSGGLSTSEWSWPIRKRLTARHGFYQGDESRADHFERTELGQAFAGTCAKAACVLWIGEELVDGVGERWRIIGRYDDACSVAKPARDVSDCRGDDGLPYRHRIQQLGGQLTAAHRRIQLRDDDHVCAGEDIEEVFDSDGGLDAHTCVATLFCFVHQRGIERAANDAQTCRLLNASKRIEQIAQTLVSSWCARENDGGDVGTPIVGSSCVNRPRVWNPRAAILLVQERAADGDGIGPPNSRAHPSRVQRARRGQEGPRRRHDVSPKCAETKLPIVDIGDQRPLQRATGVQAEAQRCQVWLDRVNDVARDQLARDVGRSRQKSRVRPGRPATNLNVTGCSNGRPELIVRATSGHDVHVEVITKQLRQDPRATKRIPRQRMAQQAY